MTLGPPAVVFSQPLQFPLDERLARRAGLFARVFPQVLGQGGHGVGGAVVLDLAGLGQVHEVLAGAAQPVAGGAERRYLAHLQEFADDLFQRAVVADAELLLVEVLHAVTLAVATDLDAGAPVDLRTAEVEQLAAQFSGLARGEDHAHIGHRQAQDGDEPLEVGVAQRVLGLEGAVAGVLEAREGEGVRADPEGLLQVDGVGQQRQGLETPVVEAEEHAQAHVVAARFHGPVLPVEPPQEVRLGPALVDAGVGGPVVGLLEDLIGAYAGVLDQAVSLHVQGRAVDVDAADLAAVLSTE